MTDTFEGRTIVMRVQVGSWASNLQTSTSDEDWKYFIAPTFDDLYSGTFFATASVSDTFDYDVHDIRKLSELLWKSNLNFIGCLFGLHMSIVSELAWIPANAERLAQMNLPYFWNAARGMHIEKMSTLLKGTGNTQNLIERFGYDTKQATHAMRCLLVLERVTRMSMREALWFSTGSPDQRLLLDIKAGMFTLEEFRNNVSDWKVNNMDRIEEWFSKRVARPEINEELNSVIKEAIRINLVNENRTV